MLLGAGLIAGVVELLLLLPLGATARIPIDSSDESGGGICVGRASAVSVAATIVDVPGAIGGGAQLFGSDAEGMAVADVVRPNPTFAGGVFGGVENAREERRVILKPGDRGLGGEKRLFDCCRVMGGAAPGGRRWARERAEREVEDWGVVGSECDRLGDETPHGQGAEGVGVHCDGSVGEAM